MNRKIIFRGWNIKYKCWDYVNNPMEDCALIDKNSVGQYTGLKDKNGKEIYEGDILEYIGKRKDNMNKVYRRKCVFHEGMFALLSKELPAYSALNYHCMKDGRSAWRVIGNTYDNSEMMKGDSNEA